MYATIEGKPGKLHCAACVNSTLLNSLFIVLIIKHENRQIHTEKIHHHLDKYKNRKSEEVNEWFGKATTPDLS